MLKRFAPAAIIVALLALLVGQALTSNVTPTATAVPAPAPTLAPAATAVPAATTLVSEAAPAAKPAPAAKTVHRVPATTNPQRLLAGQDCREKRFEDRAEFGFDYGRGRQAITRCIDAKIREARFDCTRDATEDPYDFRSEYGTGTAAMTRCIRDDLS